MSLFPTRYIALQLGPIAIHWYGIMYLLAFLTVWWVLPRIAKYRGLSFSKEQLSSLLTYGVLGTLIGGRLGYIIFYAPEYFGDHPLEMFQVWRGGMSSHGGFIGVAIAGLLYCRKRQIDVWKFADLIVVPIAIGLAFGRFGNFINQELYGPPTDLPWAIAIPGAEGLRHPTQIYAVIKNLVIAGSCFALLRRTNERGKVIGLFLLLYGLLRFFIEFVRVETAAGIDMGLIEITRGQFLTIPLIVIGAYILWNRKQLR